MKASIEYPTQPKEVQEALEAAVGAAKQADADKDGLHHFEAGGYRFSGRITEGPRFIRFVVTARERLNASTDAAEAAAAKAPAKKAPSKKATAKKAPAKKAAGKK